MKTTIFDLQKRQNVWGGIFPQGNGFAKNAAMSQELEITRIQFHYGYTNHSSFCHLYPIRFTFGGGMVTKLGDLYENKIYETASDFPAGENEIIVPDDNVILKEIFEKLGIEYSHKTEIWRWDTGKNKAVIAEEFDHIFDLSDLKLPEGFYATKEECEIANKKVVTVEIIKTYHTEVDEDQLHDLISCPEQYDFGVNELKECKVRPL